MKTPVELLRFIRFPEHLLEKYSESVAVQIAINVEPIEITTVNIRIKNDWGNKLVNFSKTELGDWKEYQK